MDYLWYYTFSRIHRFNHACQTALYLCTHSRRRAKS